MTIQFNTDKNTSGTETFTAPYIAQIESELSRFSGHITRIEVHLSDENGHKDGLNTKRCLLEARVEGMRPIAVTNQSNSYDQAMRGALHTLTGSLTTMLDKMNHH